MGSISTMITMLKNNKLIKKKVLHFKDRSRAKYRNSELIFKKGTKEDIEKTLIKIRKQHKINLIKKMIILIISIVIVYVLYLYIIKTFK